jgi:hypothetical protein
LGQILDLQLVEAYLKLDTDQLTSRKIASQFVKVVELRDGTYSRRKHLRIEVLPV